MTATKLLSVKGISSHNIPTDAWIVVNGKVYDVTDFAPEHPGGAGIILRYAGRDATKAYEEVHPPSVIDAHLPPDKFLGTLDENSLTPEWIKQPPEATEELAFKGQKPPLSTIINTYDFENVASKTISKKAWAFYSSAATDLITRKLNKKSYDRIFFRPRILRNVTNVDTRTVILGNKSSLPFFVSPAAMAKLIHPEGEKPLARGAASEGIIPSVSTNASFPVEEIVPEAPKDYPFFFQLYVNKDRRKSEELLRKVQDLGIKAIIATVDAPVAGKREEDERVKADESVSTPMSSSRAKNDSRGGGLGRIMGAFVDASLCWEDIPWLRKATSLPIILKGVQTAADAKLAMKHGIEAIMVSNHGGRSLDTSPPAILILLELQRCCPEVFDAMEVYIDGGIRRGTDILKALCLGARAVGLGRHFLYALNYGQEGVEHLIGILRDELETSMRMVGITDLSQVHPGLVNTLGVDHLIPTGEDHPYAKWRPAAKL